MVPRVMVRDENFGALIIVVIAPIGQLVVSPHSPELDRRHNEHKVFLERAVQILGIPKELQRRVFSMHYF